MKKSFAHLAAVISACVMVGVPARSVSAQDSSTVRVSVLHDTSAAHAQPSHRFETRVLALGMVSAATWTQVIGMPEDWPRTWRGYGNRLGDQVGFAAVEESVHAGLQAVIPWRSFEPECTGARAGHAWRARSMAAVRCGLRSTFVAQTRAGEARPNVPLLGAVVAASAASLAWRPERKSAHKGQLFVLTRIGIVTGATVMSRSYRAWRR